MPAPGRVAPTRTALRPEPRRWYEPQPAPPSWPPLWPVPRRWLPACSPVLPGAAGLDRPESGVVDLVLGHGGDRRGVHVDADGGRVAEVRDPVDVPGPESPDRAGAVPPVGSDPARCHGLLRDL